MARIASDGDPGRSCEMHRALVLVLLVLLAAPACATPLRTLPVERDPREAWCCTRGEEALTLQYLGVGGWLLRMGDAAILTAPFFSNPGLFEVGFGTIEPEPAAIDAHLPSVVDVEAVLVGHAHYDHLMDVPYVLREHAPRARMYGSRTAVNLVLGEPGLDPERLVAVEAEAGDHEAPGGWFHTSNGRVRFMPLLSGHAPHFLGMTFYEGQLEAPADTLPDRAGDWVEGTPLAYLIDFLSPDGDVVFRVHYQDAASTPPAGFPPPLGDGIPVDLAILCAPGYEEVTGHPEGILERLRPSHVLVGHWEDFFRGRDEELRAVPNTDLRGFLRRVEDGLPEGARWAMLEPGAEIRVEESGGGGARP